MAGDDRERRPVARPALVVHEGGKDQPQAQQATPIAGRPFGTRAAQGAFVAATLAAGGSNQALLGALQGKVDLDDPLLVRLGKGEGGLTPELSPYAPIEQQASNRPEAVKAADALKKHADDLGAGLYRPAATVADQRASLKARQEQLEGEIASLSGEIATEQEEVADLDEDIGAKQSAVDVARGALDKRQTTLQAQVARAKAKGKNPPDVERDGEIRGRKRDLEQIPGEIGDLREDQSDLGEEIQAEAAQQEAKQEELSKVAEQLAALAPKAGGGGGAPAASGPPREVDPVKTGAKVAAALDGKKTKVERDLSKLTREGETLKAKLEQLARDIPAKKLAIDAAQSDLDAARSAVTKAEADVAGATEDEEKKKLQGALATAKSKRSGAESKLSSLKSELKRLEEEQKKTTTAAEQNAEKAKAAEEEKEKLEGDIEQMRSVGCEAWQMCADAYGIKVQAVYLPPGVHPDDTPEMKKFREEAEAKKKAAEEAAAADPAYVPPDQEAGPSEQDKAKEKEKEEEKERAEREALLAKIGAAQDLPEAQRDAAMQRLASEAGKEPGELVAEHRTAVAEAEKKVAEKSKDLLTAKDVAAFAKANGLSASEAALLQRDLKRRQFEARAADALGVAPGDEAAAKKAAEDLRKKAHDRGMAPDALLTHVAALPDADVPADLKDLRAGAVRTQKDPIDVAAVEAAQKGEKRFTDEKDLAEKLGVRPEDARRYIKGLAANEGSEEKALEKLKGASDAKALKELVGSTMRAVADDTGMYGDKTVASEGLQAELDRIQALPPHERYEAIKALKQVTGQDINTLISSGRRGKRRDEALASAAEVAYDPNSTSEDRQKRMADLAGKYHLSAEALEKALTKRTDNVAAKIGKENVEKLADPTLDPKKRAELVAKLKKDTGVAGSHLDQLAARQEQKATHRRWKDALGLEPDKVITEAKRRGMKPEELLDHVRRCPENELPEGLRGAKGKLAAWDQGAGKKLLDAKKDADRKARVDAKLFENEKAVAVSFDDPRYKARKQALLDELNSTHVDDDEAKRLLSEMSPAERAALLREGVHDEDGRPLFGPNGSFQDGVGDTASVEKLMAEAAAYNKVLAAQPKQEDAAKKAAQVERDLQATVAVSQQLGVSEEEARLHLKVLAATNGGKPLSEVAKQLTEGGKPAKEVLKDVYTKGGINAPLRLQLDLVATLPPEERAQAMERLRDLTGLSPKQFGEVRREVARQERIQRDVASLARLPADVRAKELERLAKLHGLDVESLQGVAAEATAADESLLRGSGAGAAVDRFVGDLESSLDPKDVQAKAKEIAEASGLPVETVLAAIDRRRLARAEASATKALGPEGVSTLQREAALRGMTLEELQNYLLKVSPDELKSDDLRKMRAALEQSGAKVRWSEKEKQDQARAGLRLDPNGPDYAKYVEKRGKLMGLLEGSQSDDDVLAAFRAMTPAERRQLIAEQGADALKDKLEGALEFGDENEALDLLESSKADPLDQYEAIDASSPEYTDARDAIVAELSNGIDEADADDVKERLAKLPPAARAQLLRDLGALQKQLEKSHATSTGDADEDTETIPCTDLEALFEDDPEARAWVADAKRAQTVFVARQDLAKTIEERAEITSGAMGTLGISDPAVAWSTVTATGSQLGLSPKAAFAFLRGDTKLPEDEVPEWIADTVAKTLVKIDDVAGLPTNPEPVEIEELDDDEFDAWVRKASPAEIAEMDAKLGGKLRERLVERDSIEARGSLARLKQYEASPVASGFQPDAQLDRLMALSSADRLDALLNAGSEQGLMSPVLQAQWAAIERLPASQREGLQSQLASLTGREVGELRQTAARADAQLDCARKVAEIDQLPAAERQAALEKLSAESGVPQDELLALKDGAVAAGLIEVGAKKEEAPTIDADQKGAEELERVLDGGDEDKIKALIGRYKTNPGELQRVLELYGGREKLQEALDGEFNFAWGTDDPDYVDLMAVVDTAVSWRTGDDDASRAANHELQVGLDAARFEAELDDWGGVNDSRIRDLLKDCPPERLLDVKERLAARGIDLDQALSDGVDEKLYADYRASLDLGAAIAGLPPEEANAKRTEMRVAYKSEQLKAELALGQDADKDRLKDLLGDVDDAELERIAETLDAAGVDFRGQLDEALKPRDKIWGYLAGAAVGVLAFWAGPAAIAAGVGVANFINDQADPSLMRIQMKVRDVTEDPEEALQPHQENVDAAYATLQKQFSGVFASDKEILGALQELNPAELVALRAQFEKESPGKSFEEILGDQMSGDELALAMGALQNAQDAVDGVDRRKQVREGVLDAVRNERYHQLELDPKNAGKSPSELWRMVEAEGPKLQQQAADRQKKVTESAQALFDAMDGWGDDEEAVNRTLAGLSPAEAELVKIEYRRHFGRDLDTVLSTELGTDDVARARGLMSEEGRLEALRSYALGFTEGWSEDEEGLFGALEALSPEERAAITDGPKGAAFMATLTRDLGDNERILVEALTEKDPETGLAQPNAAHVAAAKMNMHLHGSGDWDVWSGWGTKEEELVSELDKLTPEQVAEAERWFDEHAASGSDSFRAALADDLGHDSEEWKIAEAELRGDKVSADVHRLKWAAQEDGEKWITIGLAMLFFPLSTGLLIAAGAADAAGIDIGFIDTTDDELIEKTLSAAAEGRGGRGPDHLKQVLGAFDAIYGREGSKYGGRGGAFDAFLQDETSAMQREFFRQIAEKGQADDELVLLYALQGAGTDESKAKQVLEKLHKKSPAEREAFARRFEAMAHDLLGSDQSLDAWIDEDFGGAEAMEMKLLAEGEPRTPQDKLRIAKMRWEFERGGISDRLFGNGIMDALEDLGAHHKGSLLADETAEIYGMFAPDGTFVGDEARFEELVAWQTGDQKSYRQTRDQVADAVSTTIQVAGGIVLAVVPGGQGASAALILSLLAAAAKAAVKGGGYSMEEAGVDVANALVAAATAGLGEALQGVKFLGNGLTATILKQMIEGGVEGFLNAAISSEQAFAEGDFAAFEHILKGTVGGAVRNGAMAGLGDYMGKSKLGQRLKALEDVPTRGSFAEHFALKYVDGVIKAGVGTALDADQLQAWADGKGLDANLVKSIFVDTAIKAAGETGLNRTKTIQRMKRDHAAAEMHQAEERVRKLESELPKDGSEPSPALARKLADAREDYGAKRGALEFEDEKFGDASRAADAAAVHAELVEKKRQQRAAEEAEAAAKKPLKVEPEQTEQDVVDAEQQAAVMLVLMQRQAQALAEDVKKPVGEPTPKERHERPVEPELTPAEKKMLQQEQKQAREAQTELQTVGQASVPAQDDEEPATLRRPPVGPASAPAQQDDDVEPVTLRKPPVVEEAEPETLRRPSVVEEAEPETLRRPAVVEAPVAVPNVPAGADSGSGSGSGSGVRKSVAEAVDADQLQRVQDRIADELDLDDTDEHALRQREVLDRILASPDGEVAARALALLESGGENGAKRLQAALDHAATHSDPDAAADALDAAVRKIELVDEIAKDIDYARANQRLLGEAQEILAKDPKARLSPQHVQALLDEAVGNARIQHLAELSALGFDDAFSAGELGGTCNAAQGRVERDLKRLGVGEVVRHATQDDDDPGAAMMPKTWKGAPKHYFAVVRMPDGHAYLVDPTFAQFLRNDGARREVADHASQVGHRLVQDDAGELVAKGLAKDGYVRLTDEVAAAYGRALTGRDGITADEMLRPTQAKDLSNAAENAEITDRERGIYAGRKERDYAEPEAAEAPVARAQDEAPVGRASVTAQDEAPVEPATAPVARKSVADVVDAERIEALRAQMGGDDEHAVRQRDALERIVAGHDGEVAARALVLLENAGPEGTKRLLAALERAGAHTDPNAAATALDAEIRQIELVDAIAARRDYNRANQRLVEEARAALKKDPNAQLSPAHAQALLDDAVGFARKQHMAEYGVGLDDGFTPEMLGGICTTTQGRVEKQLTGAGVGEVVRHATHADEDDRGADGKLLPKPFEDASGHYFLVVKMPDGNHYLVDPTFGQFLNNKGADSHEADKASQVGHRMVQDEAGKALAESLVTDGYVRLDAETAAIYARALTGTDEFGLDELLSPTQSRTVSGRSRGTVGEREDGLYGALPEREAGEVAPAPKPKAAEPAPVVDPPLAPAGKGRTPEEMGDEHKAFAQDAARRYLAATDDFDSADAPERRKAAEREVAILAQIGRIQDPDLASAAFAMLRGGDPDVHARLHDLLSGVDRTSQSNPARAVDRLRDGLSSIRQSEGGRRADHRNEIRESTRKIGELTEKAFAPGTDAATRDDLLRQAREQMDGIRAIRDSYGDKAAEVDTESPMALLAKQGHRWSDAKAAYDKDGETHKLWALVYFRKEVVDGILDEVEFEQQPHGKGFRRESLGSTNRTSDYDLSADGMGDAQAVKRFNEKFRERFGAESGDVFDTNVYTRGAYMTRQAEDGKHVDQHTIRDERARAKDDAQQNTLGLVKARKHLDDEQWRALREGIETTAVADGDPAAAAKFAKDAAEAEALHAQAQERVQTRMKELAGPDGDTSDPELELQAKNQLYAESVARVRNLHDRKVRYEADLDPDPSKWTETQKLRMDAMSLRIRQAQGEALLFAHEAYFSEGAIRHVVENVQGKKGLTITEQQARSSFNEQLGDAFKDFHHYDGDFGTTAYRSSKYLERMLGAAGELGVDLKGPDGQDVHGAVRELVAVRRAEVEPYKSMSPDKKAELSAEILKKAGLADADALKQWVIDAGVKVNRGAKAGTEAGPTGKAGTEAGPTAAPGGTAGRLAKESLDRHGGDFNAAWAASQGADRAALADHREASVRQLLADVGVALGPDDSPFHHITVQFAAMYLPEADLARVKAKHGPALEALGVRAIDDTLRTNAFDGYVTGLLGQSPTLLSVWKKLKADDWDLVSGAQGVGGGVADRANKQIRIHGDPNDPRLVHYYAGLIAHEMGHADFRPTMRQVTDVPALDVSALRWLVEPHMYDEAVATRANLVVRDEILAAGGPDIGVIGRQSAEYIAAWGEFKRDGDTTKLLATLTNQLFGESLGAGLTYFQYWSQYYKQAGAHAGVPVAPGPEADLPSPIAPRGARSRKPEQMGPEHAALAEQIAARYNAATDDFDSPDAPDRRRRAEREAGILEAIGRIDDPMLRDDAFRVLRDGDADAHAALHTTLDEASRVAANDPAAALRRMLRGLGALVVGKQDLAFGPAPVDAPISAPPTSGPPGPMRAPGASKPPVEQGRLQARFALDLADRLRQGEVLPAADPAAAGRRELARPEAQLFDAIGRIRNAALAEDAFRILLCGDASAHEALRTVLADVEQLSSADPAAAQRRLLQGLAPIVVDPTDARRLPLEPEVHQRAQRVLDEHDGEFKVAWAVAKGADRLALSEVREDRVRRLLDELGVWVSDADSPFSQENEQYASLHVPEPELSELRAKHGAALDALGVKTLDADVHTGILNAFVEDLAGRSPWLKERLADLKASGWTFRAGTSKPQHAGEVVRATPAIHIDDQRDDLDRIKFYVGVLAHEVGHALHTPRLRALAAAVDDAELDALVRPHLEDEAHAVVAHLRVHEEILAAAGQDIGLQYGHAADYQAAWRQYKIDGDHDQLIRTIADRFADEPVGAITYREHYASGYRALAAHHGIDVTAAAAHPEEAGDRPKTRTVPGVRGPIEVADDAPDLGRPPRARQIEIVAPAAAPYPPTVQKVGKRYPRNGRHAGEAFPLEPALAARYPAGVRFNLEGFPDFSPYVHVLPDGSAAEVQILYTGNRAGDFREANAAVGLAKEPPGYTWHHHEDGTTMQLIPTDLHDGVPHTGGYAVDKARSP